ncbi:hypothetical protein LSTR_LSTR000727 [Laodelphax striatellus]|uniref:Uncharacterized protein n=1 Tax=Laodelphax striatellus TaxID=195883 RepID=A0A482XFG2_LAOST|nr:hypothetical protein LSTR_LSTR000727 [Laodelphax striatellus]
MSLSNFAVSIDGVLTDFVIGDYSDNLFIAITQFQKLGCIVSVRKDVMNDYSSAQEEVYDVCTLLGSSDESTELAARYLAEQLNIPKSVIFSINLKDKSLRTLKAIRKVLLPRKSW